MTIPEQPRALVLRTAGTNCDAEMVRAFRLAGCAVDLVHVDRLSRDATPIERADLIGFPGGFSYGDDIASGRILAARLRERLWSPLRDAAARGVPMIGVCNGFQVLVQVGLLPGPLEAGSGDALPDAPPRPMVALAHNEQGRFVDRWVGVEAAAGPEGSPCVWTRSLAAAGGWPAGAERVMMPIAHGEGRFVARDAATLDALVAAGRVVLRYTEPVNGSEGDIAGICDATGRIFGLMPHPERALDWTRHPAWTRLGPETRGPDAPMTPGRMIFESAVASVREAQRSAVGV